MVSSGTESGPLDCGIGSIVWVRRRNGSWWPGKILGPDELSASHLMSPRSGTPVKLLGREDASVDWYNLEKSKRVKAFRCGEFDDFIQRAEASLGMPPKKREKYARREDAILHALELERQLGKRYGLLGCSSTDRSNKSTDDFSGRESQTYSKYLDNGKGRRLRSKSRQLSHKSGFFVEEKSTCNFSSIQEPKGHNQFSGDDDNSDVPPRMRGLQDLGLSTAPSEHRNLPSIASDGADLPVLDRSVDAVPDGIYNAERLVSIERKNLSVKRKLSDEGLAEEILVKRRGRSCPLAQLLESSENLPDSGSVSISEMGEEHPGVAKKSRCNLAEEPTESLTVEESNHAQMELSTLKHKDTGSHPAELCEQNASGSTEYTETDSSETDSAEDTDDELATISDGAASIELEPKYIGRSEAQPGHGSISSEELDDGTSHTCHQESVSTGFGVSKWQLKGKRNNRSLNKRPLDPFDGNLALRPCHMNSFRGKRGYGSLQDDPVMNSWVQMAGYGSRAPRNAGQNMFSCVDWAWDDQPASKGYWEESTEGFDSVNSYHHSGGRTMLVNVDLKVQSSYQREHVPMISLTSKINGQAIVGYPVQIEVLSNGSSESLLWAVDGNFPETSDNDTALQPMWRTARRTGNVRVPRPHASSALDNAEGIKHVQGFDRDKNVQKASVGGVVQKGSMTRTAISRPAIERTFPRKSGKRISVSSYQKVRTLSSIALQQKHSDQKGSSTSHQVDAAIKRETLPTVIACIPVKLVFSRLSEELVGRHQ
ncbi:uncharacterized protein At1g51745-like isoform X1 [Lycium barbarum]|uniref:uncharacterized protein At1g51745-like isoform X1 n=2 Tax=Lycium barbarum TaxID=112863 RepID=UPI00293EA9DE|nr:uncharacterized protein At1g51745-like isoform X1 [Lycium barbarum]